ncbi:MAG: ABC transporter permease subunit [Nocardioides sp.]
MTTTAERPVELGAAPPVEEKKDRFPRWMRIVAILGVWIAVWYFTRGTQTLVIDGIDQTKFHARLSKFAVELKAGRDTNPLMAFTQWLTVIITDVTDFLRRLIAIPTSPRPAPTIGWLGVVAIATWIGYAVANWRIALLVCATFLSFGVFGYWEDSMDLVVVTVISVAFAALIGFPLAIWMAISDRVNRVMTIVLDLLQTMPTFVYLVPVILFFGIGVPAAVMCTLAYALPPVVRIASFGIRNASPTVVEATNSLGQSTMQRLLKVQVPMARRTIILGLNQTTLAALSMAIIASYISGPGLGKPVLAALTLKNVGAGFVPGMLIVAMGIMFDRATTAASERAERVARGGGGDPKRRRITLAALLIPVAVAVWYSRWSLDAAVFPELTVGKTLADAVNTVTDGFVSRMDGPAGAFKDLISYGLLNPLQSLLAESPWWLSLFGLLALSLVIGGRRAAVPTVLCLVGLAGLQLWHDSMLTLTMTLVATVLVMLLGVLVGVWMGRSPKADLFIRPILDAAQTIPAFVYLLPILALFGIGRFTAIVAGLIYAAPAAIKIVADGIRNLPGGTIEAGRSVGTTKWQEIFGIQLPMAKGSMLLATNQGLLYVLAMVVIGAMVGAQALGYDVILGVAHMNDFWGKGMCAGLSIALMGIWIDRVMRAAAAREGSSDQPQKA